MQTLVRRKQEGLFYNRKTRPQKKENDRRQRHYIMIKEPVPQKDIGLLNVYAQMNNM